jgi:hypothetical protein
VTHPSPVHDSVFSSVRPLRDVNLIDNSHQSMEQHQYLSQGIRSTSIPRLLHQESRRKLAQIHTYTHKHRYVRIHRNSARQEIGYQRLQAHITSRGSSPQPRSFASPARARREHAATSLRRPSRIPIPIPTPRKSACSRSRVSEAILEHQVQQSIAPAPTLLLLCQTTRPQASRSLHNASAQMRSHSAHKRWGIRCYTQAVGLIATA